MGVGRQATARGGEPRRTSCGGHTGAYTSPDSGPPGPDGRSHDVSALCAVGQELLGGGHSLHHSGC
eukprot:3622333-Alexandrium_andersonii.AAC.1